MSLPGDEHWPSGPTGRYLVTLGEGGATAAARVLRDVAGLRSASSGDWQDGSVAAEAIVDPRGLVFEHLGVAVADLDPDQLAALQAAIADGRSPVIAVEPEQYVHALAGAGALGTGGIATPYTDNSYFTWGLQATGVDRSGGSARGIRVAVLDSGLDLGHPDFQGRAAIAMSFVAGQSAQDGYGHGTHCTGTSCGRRQVSSASRGYGIASDAEILVGKVLNDTGWGADAWVIAGINWAVAQRAAIISMSLGSLVVAGAGYAQAYESAAQAALAAGSLVIAAAGNAGKQPVWSPANCPSVLAVAAVDSGLRHAEFSCVGLNGRGGEINLAGPGVNVFSSTPMPSRTRFMDGTSMATPHVAGCAALWAQGSGLRGRALWDKLLATARPLGAGVQQVGAGLVQAPP